MPVYSHAPAEVPRKPKRRLRLGRIAALLACGSLLVLGLAAEDVLRQATVDETRPAGAIVVFGAAEYAGRPSPVFRARLDHAYELFQQGMAPLVITTGGGAHDPKFTEGGVGHDYLQRRGIPDAYLIAETQSKDTADSAQRTATIMRANGITDCDAVSDAYHMFRIKKLLQAQGIKAYAAPRPGSMPQRPYARALTVLRESASYLAWKLHLT
jgi:uncharacterized SAM-binding protein YcdF (DUF218 family)